MLTPVSLMRSQAFLDKYTDEDQPTALEPILRSFNPNGERHPSMFERCAGRCGKPRRVGFRRNAQSMSCGSCGLLAAVGTRRRLRQSVCGMRLRVPMRTELWRSYVPAPMGSSSIEAWRGAQNGFESWTPVIDEPCQRA